MQGWVAYIEVSKHTPTPRSTELTTKSQEGSLLFSLTKYQGDDKLIFAI